MKDIDRTFWYEMLSEQQKRRNISGIYIFDKFPNDERRQPTCVEDCQQDTRRAWVMKRGDTDYAKQAITMIYDAFLKLCDYLYKEGCLSDEYLKGISDMAKRNKEEIKYNWGLHELANHLDLACDKLCLLADAYGVKRGGEG